MTSGRIPRGLHQEQVVGALVRADGVLDRAAGKGSHVRVTMPSGAKVFVPAGIIRTGTLAALIKQAGLAREEFNALL